MGGGFAADPSRLLRRTGALAGADADPGSTGPRAGAVLAPVAPGPVLLHLVGVLPHAVTFVAPLRRRRDNRGPMRGETN